MTAAAIVKPKCGAKTRAGTACALPAGSGTDHPGLGRCRRHGGATPIRSGRYSTIQRERLRELVTQFEADPDPLNVLPEIAALRALFQDFIERYETFTDALLLWYASVQFAKQSLPPALGDAFGRLVDTWEARSRAAGMLDADELQRARRFVALARDGAREGRPRQVLDLADARNILGEIGKMAERVWRADNASAVSRGDLLRIMNEFAKTVMLVINDEVRDPALAERILHRVSDGWISVQL